MAPVWAADHGLNGPQRLNLFVSLGGPSRAGAVTRGGGRVREPSPAAAYAVLSWVSSPANPAPFSSPACPAIPSEFWQIWAQSLFFFLPTPTPASLPCAACPGQRPCQAHGGGPGKRAEKGVGETSSFCCGHTHGPSDPTGSILHWPGLGKSHLGSLGNLGNSWPREGPCPWAVA